ncbi:hypothetical protein C8R45DRAFT_929071 [Mycena sanguinolenta]|nr:hypothetical protein C8R45DRAFT_929071 [Mycena sanguinolenta]
MLISTQTLIFLAASSVAVLPSVTAVAAPAGEKMIFSIHNSNNATVCLVGSDNLSLTMDGCDTSLDTLAWIVTAGSAASTSPPLGTITHQYLPSDTLPLNGTYCLAPNVTTTNIATIADGTAVILKTCNSADVTQKWGVRDGDGTIRLGNGNKCLTQLYQNYGKFTLHISTCVAGDVDQKWTPIPKPPGESLTGYEPGSSGMAIYQEDIYQCLSVIPGGNIIELTECTFGYVFYLNQNFTFTAGSSFVGKGAAGPITLESRCLDLVTYTYANGTSTEYLGAAPCTGSATQQWQVNNDSTINIANTNQCVGQTTVTLAASTWMQVADCVPGTANQIWDILQPQIQPADDVRKFTLRSGCLLDILTLEVPECPEISDVSGELALFLAIPTLSTLELRLWRHTGRHVFSDAQYRLLQTPGILPNLETLIIADLDPFSTPQGYHSFLDAVRARNTLRFAELHILPHNRYSRDSVPPPPMTIGEQLQNFSADDVRIRITAPTFELPPGALDRDPPSGFGKPVHYRTSVIL